MVARDSISVASGEDAESVAREATQLVDGAGRWTLCSEGRGVEREFVFKTFKTTWDFMTAVADQCRKARHHPEWSNVYNRTHIRWTTHSPRGLSTKDTAMARFCDQAALQYGELESGTAEAQADCCGPK